MNSIQYVRLDVHRDTISVAVLNAEGKLVMQSVIATHASAILDFLHGLRGRLQVTFEEGTHSGWLYDLLVRRVAQVVVCNPRKNGLLKAGSKSDAIDARKLAELLRAGLLSPVYHGQRSTAAVQHLGRRYAGLTEDTTRIMGRLKALYRSQAIACAGSKVFGSRHRDEWLAQLSDRGMQRRARRLYQDLDGLQQLRREARQDLIQECRQHSETKWLRTVPWLGPIRVALLIGRVQTPQRFRTKRQFWAYCGLGLETRDSGEYRVVNGQIERKKKPLFIRGLNRNHNHDLKNLFKSAATAASGREGGFGQFYENLSLRLCHNFFSALIPALLHGKWDSVRPGDERLKNFSNGVKAPWLQRPCHHASDRQYRSHAFMRAQEAPIGSRP
jgi:transposase